MINKHYLLIKSLRKEHGFSQLEISKKLDISRTSYISFEQGKRELTLSEAEKLTDVFGISITEIESGIKANYEKYKEMILAYLRSKPDMRDGVPKTKLAKLLYLADFSWFYKNLKSMSGMEYRKIQFGPVPDLYFRAIDELFESGKIDIKKTSEGAMLISQTRGGETTLLKEISREEKDLIDDISNKWCGKRTQEIVDFTHNQMPYSICRENEIIPYELITQEDPENIY
jgi:transcriptional regulator with XRE-family HTH domain